MWADPRFKKAPAVRRCIAHGARRVGVSPDSPERRKRDGQILLFRNFHRKRQHDAPGKLGVPLVLYGFRSVPERCTVCISGWRMGRQHDLGVDKFFLLVVEFRFLVVLTEQPFAALVSGPGNSGLPLAALDDSDFEMRTRNRHHPLDNI